MADVGKLGWSVHNANVGFALYMDDYRSCLNLVNSVNGDWKFDYIENMNTWVVEKSVLSWTVYVRTKAVVPNNKYCK